MLLILCLDHQKEKNRENRNISVGDTKLPTTHNSERITSPNSLLCNFNPFVIILGRKIVAFFTLSLLNVHLKREKLNVRLVLCYPKMKQIWKYEMCQQLAQRGQVPFSYFFCSNYPQRGSFITGKAWGLSNEDIREILCRF